MEKRIYKLMDAKGRVLIPKELRVETGIGYGDIVALEIADGKLTLRKVTVIEPGCCCLLRRMRRCCLQGTA